MLRCAMLIKSLHFLLPCRIQALLHTSNYIEEWTLHGSVPLDFRARSANRPKYKKQLRNGGT